MNPIRVWANDGRVFVPLTEQEVVETMENNRHIHEPMIEVALHALLAAAAATDELIEVEHEKENPRLRRQGSNR
jgi:hypothetical protein